MKFPNDWKVQLQDEYRKDYFIELEEFVEKEYNEQSIFPPKEQIFRAFELTPFKDVKVVIMGQDPYHDDGQAQGLAFSVDERVAIPKSLCNIYKELQEDIGATIPNHGCLEKWAGQGVLLMNAVLTVRAHTPESHQKMGWEQLTDEVIKQLQKKDSPIVFLLWGAHARKKAHMITNPHHFIIESPHPSPLSAYRGFFGSKPFSKINEFLVAQGTEPIDWQIENIE